VNSSFQPHCRRHQTRILAVLLALTLSACGGDDSKPVIPLPAAIPVGNSTPEDITADGDRAFVSNLTDGSVTRIDLANGGAASIFVPPATDSYSSAWGLRIVPSKNWLLSIQNPPYDFNPAHAGTGRVVAFDLDTGTKIKSWDLPADTVGNSLDVDKSGNIYVGDFGPHTRIVKIDAQTNAVSIWATDSRWVDNSFGFGGLVYSGTGLYAAHDNKLWFIAIHSDGTPAAPAVVSIAGNPVIFADGMTWTGSGIDYSYNDLFVAGNHGVAYRVDFSDPTTGVQTVLETDLADPSGMTTATVNGKTYLLVNESQLGEAGPPDLPYVVKTFLLAP